MVGYKQHIEEESKGEETAKLLINREQLEIDTETTEVQRGYPLFTVGGEDPDRKGKIRGLVVFETYRKVGYVTFDEECIDTGPGRSGLTVIYLEDGTDCMIDGAIVKFIRYEKM